MQITALRHGASDKSGGGSVSTGPTHTLSTPVKDHSFYSLLCSSPSDGLLQLSSRRCPRASSNAMSLLRFLLDIWGKSGRKDEFLVVNIVFL